MREVTFFFFFFTLVAQMVKHLLGMQETQIRFLGLEDPLEKEMATHTSTLAWKIPWTEKAGGLQSIEVKKSRHDLATKQQCMYIRVCI